MLFLQNLVGEVAQNVFEKVVETLTSTSLPTSSTLPTSSQEVEGVPESTQLVVFEALPLPVQDSTNDASLTALTVVVVVFGVIIVVVICICIVAIRVPG